MCNKARCLIWEEEGNVVSKRRYIHFHFSLDISNWQLSDRLTFFFAWQSILWCTLDCVYVLISKRPKPEFEFLPKVEMSVHCRNRISAETKISVEIAFSAKTAKTDYKSEKIFQNKRAENCSKTVFKSVKTNLEECLWWVLDGVFWTFEVLKWSK